MFMDNLKFYKIHIRILVYINDYVKQKSYKISDNFYTNLCTYILRRFYCAVLIIMV
jgi:hypothetical protein